MPALSIMRFAAKLKRSGAALARNESGIAATEFAAIVPLMFTMFFGTVEITSGIAADRKVTLIARTLSDLPSQGDKVNSTELQNFFTASGSIMWPYEAPPLVITVSQIYIDANKIARVTWSKSANMSRSGGQTSAAMKISKYNVNDVVPLNTALAVPDTYLIWSEVSYNYKPTIGYIMGKPGVTLSDASYARPRQSKCVPFTEVVGGYTFGTC